MPSEREKRKPLSARQVAKAQMHDSVEGCILLPEGCSFWEIKSPCTKRIDHLPYITGEGNPYQAKGVPHWERMYFRHKLPGTGRTVVCPAQLKIGPCPVCEYRVALTRDSTGSDEDKKAIADLKPKKRQLWLLYDLDDDEDVIRVWETSYFAYGKLINEAVEADEDYEFFADPVEGLTTQIKFVQDSYNGYTFYKPSRIDFKRRKQTYDENIAEQMPCLDDMLVIEDYDQIKSYLYEDPTEGAAPDTLEEPAPRARGRRARDEDEDDDDEDDAPPKRNRRSRARDEDEDDTPVKVRGRRPRNTEDAEDDEDDTPPKRRSKAVNECVACDGTGKSSRGKQCPICKGSGEAAEVEEDDEPPKRSSRARRRPESDDDEPVSKSKTKRGSTAVAESDDDEDENWRGWDD